MLSPAGSQPCADLDGRLGRRLGEQVDRFVGQRKAPDGCVRPIATRLVSLHDPDARPIVKGRLGKPIEFGYKITALAATKA